MIFKYGRDIPEFVKRFREDYSLSQADLARRLGVHKQYVSNVERGVNENPLGFVGLLYLVLPKDRAEYLTELVSEASCARTLARLGRAKEKRTRRTTPSIKR
jgi:transcriptional regulator with XRE-family HTH domain